MTDIKLDPSKLLGFKIVANGGSVATLHSPKIGAKSCATSDPALNADRAALRATKTG